MSLLATSLINFVEHRGTETTLEPGVRPFEG
jgi:hypothetical protein